MRSGNVALREQELAERRYEPGSLPREGSLLPTKRATERQTHRPSNQPFLPVYAGKRFRATLRRSPPDTFAAV